MNIFSWLTSISIWLLTSMSSPWSYCCSISCMVQYMCIPYQMDSWISPFLSSTFTLSSSSACNQSSSISMWMSRVITIFHLRYFLCWFHCMSFQVNRIWASERRILLCTSTIIIWQIFKIWWVRLLTLQTRIKSIIALCRGYWTSVWLPKFVEVFLSYCSQNVWLSKWIWFPE